jgi:hypothetical protein
MVDLLTIQTIGVLLTGISVSIAAIYYIFTLRNTYKNRQAQLLIPIYSRFHEKEFQKLALDIRTNWEWKDYTDFMDKYGPTNLEAWASFWTVTGFFHTIGSLLKRKRIDPIIVDDLMQTYIIQYWEQVRLLIKEWRNQFNYPRMAWGADYPRMAWGAEYLYNESKKRQKLEQKT